MVLNIIVDSYDTALILAAEIFSCLNRIARYSRLNVVVDDNARLEAFTRWMFFHSGEVVCMKKIF